MFRFQNSWTFIILMLVSLFGLNTSACGADTVSVVAFGNSITRHGPAPAINWNGDWGMAASSLENDYVSQLTQLLRQQLHVKIDAMRINVSALELDPKSVTIDPKLLAAARSSNIVIVELGDNAKKASINDFQLAYAQLLRDAHPQPGLLVCLSTWWNSVVIDKLIKEACITARGAFVDIADIHNLKGASASANHQFSDPGVRSHPGDNGMSEIAARIFATWRRSRLEK